MTTESIYRVLSCVDSTCVKISQLLVPFLSHATQLGPSHPAKVGAARVDHGNPDRKQWAPCKLLLFPYLSLFMSIRAFALFSKSLLSLYWEVLYPSHVCFSFSSPRRTFSFTSFKKERDKWGVRRGYTLDRARIKNDVIPLPAEVGCCCVGARRSWASRVVGT